MAKIKSKEQILDKIQALLNQQISITQAELAKALGVTSVTLSTNLKKYEIDLNAFKAHQKDRLKKERTAAMEAESTNNLETVPVQDVAPSAEVIVAPDAEQAQALTGANEGDSNHQINKNLEKAPAEKVKEAAEMNEELEKLKNYINKAKVSFTAKEKEDDPKGTLFKLLKEFPAAGKEMKSGDGQEGLLPQWQKFLHVESNLVEAKDHFTDAQKGKEKDPRFFGWIQVHDHMGTGVDNEIGQFKGLSYIVFPMEEASKATGKPLYAATLNVGLADYGEDEALARQAGVRRGWNRILERYSNLCYEYHDQKTGIKMHLEDRYSKVTNDVQLIPGSYQASTLAFAIVDASTIEGRLMMLGMLAEYAKMRKWTHEHNRDLIFAVMNLMSNTKESDIKDEEAVAALLKGRRFVVLQGAPGTGKTRLARELVKKSGAQKDQVFFTQFHAETSYSDFVYGIYPDTAQKGMAFKAKEGTLVQAVRKAKELYDTAVKENQVPKPVYLIIDEINRANLASVLGPTFYLFESGLVYGNETGVEVKFDTKPGKDELILTALPPNLYVIATMNTADRSLAVVDFALRRRFAWYTLKPQDITLVGEDLVDKYFARKQFDDISDIFDEFATDDELNLKPGHAYFIVDRKMVMAAWKEQDRTRITEERLREYLDLDRNLSEKPEGEVWGLEKLAQNSATEDKEQEAVKEIVQRAVNIRLQYEVMPLIKEYLAEGMLPEAKNEFLSYFWHQIGETMVQ